MTPERTTRRILILLTVLALLVAACSSDDATAAEEPETEEAAAESSTSTEATTTSEATTSTVATTTTEATTTSEATTTTEAATTSEAETTDSSATGGQPVDLNEWNVDTSAALEPGTISFDVSNSGENPHAFAIARGDSYENLPQLDNGAVDTDALGADFLGTTENLETGEMTTIDFTLEAGNYVFFCPVQFGPNSHAAAGQVLSVTVG